MNSVIQQHLLSIYYIQGTDLGVWGFAFNTKDKKKKNLSVYEVHTQLWEYAQLTNY